MEKSQDQAEFDRRRYAVFVDESLHHDYFWVLIERSSDNYSEWTAFEASTHAEHTWLGAFDAGNTALVKLVTQQHLLFEKLHPPADSKAH
jgi:hypothetical protein